MAAPTLAWGVTHIYRLPNGGHLYGREFELLPAGTMFAAGTILHGVCGVEAQPIDDRRCEIRDGAMILIQGIPPTGTAELDIYRDDIAEGFRQRQAQEAQG